MTTRTMPIAAVIDDFNRLREACYELAREDRGELMEGDAWLRSALQESDLNLEFQGDAIECWGSAYTTQTWDHEPFRFRLPLERVTARL